MNKLIATTTAALLLITGCCTDTGISPVEFTGEWIGCKSPNDKLDGFTSVPARYLRTEIDLPGKVKKATLGICGLGLYETWINGVNIAPDQVLSPTLSDYDKTVYYNTFDVTDQLHKGTNALGVMLGNGRYVSMRMGDAPSPNAHYGLPKLLYQLNVTLRGGVTLSFASDSTWKITADGPIRENNEFDGETYDARMELGNWTEAGYGDSLWADASVMEDAPKGELLAQPNPNIAIQDHVTPIGITRLGDCHIVDMGQNMVGWLQIKAAGLEKGDTVTMSFAETLKEDGDLYVENLRGIKATDTYVAKDSEPIVWHPEFVYHGFRYVKVKGLKNEPVPGDFDGQVFYDKMATTGHFETSDSVINQVYRNAFWGIRGNYRGMPTDCPQRDERQGWMGDRTMGCYGESYIFDNHLLYAKWLKDIEDAQHPSGSLPDVAPRYWTIYSDNITWPGVLITAADMIYTRYGDSQPIVQRYAAMKNWLDYMRDIYVKEGIMTKDTYGDWCMPPESLELIHSKDPSRITAAAVISTPVYYHLLQLMARFAPIAGHPEDAEGFLKDAEISKTAFNNAYFHADEGCYDNNTVTANLLPLYFGMVPEGREKDVFDHIVKKTEIDCGGHVSTGVVGIMVLMRTLTEYGRGDLACRIASNDTYPSWGYMAKNGATTIWELWNGNTADPSMNSGNHVMLLGDLIIWEYEYLAGIRALEPGYKAIELKPYPVKGLSWVKCSYDSVSGTITSDWKVEDGKFIWDVTVPAGTTAKAYIPEKDGSRTEKDLKAGTHHFESEI